MALLRTSSGGSLLLELPKPKASGAALTVVRAVDGPQGTHAFAHSTSRDGKAALALATLDGGSLGLETLTIDAEGGRGEWSSREALPYDAEDCGPLSEAWLNAYAKKDGSLGHRLLLSSSDHTLQFLQV